MDGMDAVTDRNRSHYNSKSSSQSRRDRAHGPAAPLKKFHNLVKRELLNAFAENASLLLDVACGRGGDLAKWDDARVGTVMGIDKQEVDRVGPDIEHSHAHGGTLSADRSSCIHEGSNPSV